MTFAEALEVMGEGKKVTHPYFSKEEWMTFEDGKIVFEDGVRCLITEFLRWRQGEEWKHDYKIYKD